MGSALHCETLGNGLRVAVEPVDGVRSVAVRVFVPCGVIHEPLHARGVASVCAELLLRGSRTLDSRSQADQFDLSGATRNAAAGSRGCAISAVTLDAQAPRAIELVSDMVLNPEMSDESFEASRDLALQSLASLMDEPNERAVLEARARHLPDPHGRNTYGTQSGLESLTSDDARSWWSAHAGARGGILAISGAVQVQEALAWANEYFGSWGGAASDPVVGDSPSRGYAHIEDDTNQCQIIVVHNAPKAGHQDETLERLACSVLSGGMSGRLFTEVREKRGLCYSVSASYRAAHEQGVVTAQAGTTPERAQETLDVLMGELERLNEGAVTPSEFARAKTGLKSRIVFAGESTGARASSMINDLVHRGVPRTLSEMTESIERVTLDELNGYLRRRSLGTLTIQTLGPNPLSAAV